MSIVIFFYDGLDNELVTMREQILEVNESFYSSLNRYEEVDLDF